MNIAVLMTCHNRRGKTLACLESLRQQTPVPGTELTVWLVDDGSTDGTSEAVKTLVPSVQLISGSGSLFWCGGMRVAWQAAAATRPEVYLWLNDDVLLRPGALAMLHAAAQQARSEGRPAQDRLPGGPARPEVALHPAPEAIIVGSCVSTETGELSYGGKRRLGPHPGRIAAIGPGEGLTPCDTFEGNIVWIPAAVYDRVGNLAPFLHAMGDIDYGYRATRAGFRIFIAPGYLGACSTNARGGTWEDPALPRSVRWRKLTGIKGLPPQDWWRFCREHGRMRAPLYFISPYGRVLLGR